MTYLKVMYEDSDCREVAGLVVVDEDQLYDLVRHDDVKDGDVLYLVVVQYETGDSFGTSSGRIELVDTFRNLCDAKKCLEAVHKSEKTWGKPAEKFEYTMDNGAVYSCEYCAWNGYFDTIEDAYIRQLTVGTVGGKIR